MLKRLKALGYREITLRADGLLGPAGTKARGHEFHYSEMPPKPATCPGSITSRPERAANAAEGYSKNVLASYVHLHFGSNPEVARNLVASAGHISEPT